MEDLSLIPHSSLVTVPLDVRILSVAEFHDSKLSLKFNTIKDFCQAKCSRTDCVETVHSPRVVAMGPAPYIVLQLTVSETPEIITTYIPRIGSIEYVIYVLSCTSFWFGFSALAFLEKNNLFRKLIRVSPLSSESNLINLVARERQKRKQLENMVEQLRTEVMMQSGAMVTNRKRR